MAQPIIRGIQAVGNVNIYYRYNGKTLKAPMGWGDGGGAAPDIETDLGADGIPVAGIRLDSEFIRAAQQIASSNVIPLLGGGGLALTNNNRTGTLSINCTRSSSPDTTGNMNMTGNNAEEGAAYGVGVTGDEESYYDLVILAQYQQGAKGGDSQGSTITIYFDFNGMGVRVQFRGCTIQTVAPLVLSGNDAANYSVEINYLDWVCSFYDSKKASDSE